MTDVIIQGNNHKEFEERLRQTMLHIIAMLQGFPVRTQPLLQSMDSESENDLRSRN